MAVTELYTAIHNNQENRRWTIHFATDFYSTKQDPVEGDEFILNSDGFNLEYQGSSDDLFDPIKFSSLRFTVMVQNSSQETELQKILDNYDQTWYCMLFDEDDLEWYGYLNLNTDFKFENISFPYEFSIEANDVLTVMRNARVWDFILNRGWQSKWSLYSGIPPGVQPPTLKLRFGEVEGGISNLLPHKSKPTLAAAIWSLLFDLDDNLPQEFSVMTQYASPYGFHTTPPFDNIRFDVEPYIYDDHRSGSQLEITETTAIQILQDICKLTGSRIFLSKGRYWVTQIRSYLETSLLSYDYEENLNTASLASSGVVVTNFSNISTDFINISQQINHFQKAGGTFEFRIPIQEVRTEGFENSQDKEFIVSRPTNGVNNYATYSTPKERVEFIGIDQNGEIEIRNSLGGGAWTVASIIQNHPSAAPRSWYHTVSWQRAEAQNGVRKRLKLTVYSDELRFFHYIKFDDERYIIDRMTYHSETREADIEATLLELSEEDLSTDTEDNPAGDSISGDAFSQRSPKQTSGGNIITTTEGEFIV